MISSAAGLLKHAWLANLLEYTCTPCPAMAGSHVQPLGLKASHPLPHNLCHMRSINGINAITVSMKNASVGVGGGSQY